jgi:hypothetical protein
VKRSISNSLLMMVLAEKHSRKGIKRGNPGSFERPT